MAQTAGRAETINYDDVDVYEKLQELTRGRGPDRCIDAVGCEAHGGGTMDGVMDTVKTTTHLVTDRGHVIRQAIKCCRKGGTVSIPGVYMGNADVTMGAVVAKALTLKSGQTHVQRYLRPLLDRIEAGDINPAFVITHRIGLDEAPDAYKTFLDKKDGCIKVVIKP